jgi:two-component system NarL family sensor kinase
VEVGLYRIAQEALANALRHAGARTVRLRLETTPERVTLTVEDDGRGFDPAHVAGPRFGLLGMRERAKLLGGTLDVGAAAGNEGTRVVATVPLGEGT